MAVTQDELERFYRFASDQIANGDCSQTSLGELYDQWRFDNLSPQDNAENVAAIQASIDDMKAGETGRDASEVIREVRDELSLPSGE